MPTVTVVTPAVVLLPLAAEVDAELDPLLEQPASATAAAASPLTAMPRSFLEEMVMGKAPISETSVLSAWPG
jgi:hypothetical protein